MGKGFSVVANEVRKLAEQTDQSANQISTLIRERQDNINKSSVTMEAVTAEVKEGKSIVDTSSLAFQKILNKNTQTSNMIKEVNVMTKDLSLNSRNVLFVLKEMRDTSKNSSEKFQEVASTSQEQLISLQNISSSAEELNEMTENLDAELKKFK